jgi:trigger factor
MKVLGDPLPNEEKQPRIDWEKDEDFEFVFDVALAPEVGVKLDKKVKLPYYTILTDDAAVNAQIEAYTTRFGENIPTEVITDKDLVRGDFVQLNAEGEELEGGIRAEKVIIAADRIKDEVVKEALIGKKAGDSLVFDPVKTFGNRHETGHMLNISHEEAEKLEGEFRFTVIEALSFQPAMLNEDFYKKVLGDDTEVKTEEEFRESIRKTLQDNFTNSSNYKFGVDARKKLIEKTAFDLPEELLKRWITLTNKELTPEQIEEEFPKFLKDLRWQLIRDQIAREHDIKTSADDVRAVAKKMASIQFMQYGMYNVPDQYLENYATEMLKNEEEAKRLYNRAEDDKVLELIRSKVSLNEKELSQEDFNKLIADEK